MILSRFPPSPSEEEAVGESEPSEEAEEEPCAELSTDLTGGGTRSFFFGKKAALISPIPTKNSSRKACRVLQSALGLSRVERPKEERLTRNDFDQIWRSVPNVSSIINDDYHVCIAREQSL